jgi:V-type H+-transporting ATPase subunit A
LKTIAEISGSVFVPRGVDIPSLDQDRLYQFVPNRRANPFKKGDIIGGGDVIGETYENDLFSRHKIMIAPKLQGRVVEIMPDGDYNCS